MVKNKNRIKPSKGDLVFSIVTYVLIIIATLVTLYPLLYVVMASFSSSNLLRGHSGPLWWPLGGTLEAYRAIIEYPKIWMGFKNTVFVVAAGLCVSLFLTTLGAYIMSRKNFWFGKVFTFLVLFTMYFGGGMIPTYLNIKSLGLYDSLWSVILIGGLSAYNMIIMRTNFQSIPTSLEESAYLDGANDITILVKIILPLSSNVIAVMVLYYGVTYWNSWFYPAIFLQDAAKVPLQLVLRDLLIENQTHALMDDREQIDMTIKYSTIVVATLPLLCVYPFLQKYFVKGVMIGSVKG